MKPTLRSISAILLSLCTIAAGLPEKENFHLFLLAGQSNMAGRAKLEDSAAEPIRGILAMNKDLKWQPAIDPLHWDKASAAGGMGRPFAEDVLKKSKGAEIGLIPAAFGGTSVREWAPDAKASGTNLYQTAIERAQIAMKDGTLKAILWHQGEADSNERGIKVHEERMIELIGNFRKDLGIADLPFVIGQLADSPDKEKDELRKAIDDANRRVAEKMENVVFVSSKKLETADGTHFDAPSIRKFGERYADAYLELMGAK
ncbi:MAG: sialate O-acetylesterase [Akkermansiaceae bacterium]|jgi:hypothetical protein|nr:sialate O-acetylesterase [Akkermansiaceae bacterium]MDP4721222.1 sialate O-acetylesterase [Akkermansiaceae bacterium]MDP4778870.1 sialate O-acetylesterase [Akkermansiaceae bacterium]MDP4846929.1 sialate O-acetylesterase [Akkermansiaceae bacterium]MDP4897934.1 sialate O-acetylesterase [Akkermansiaceae bacterium]